VCFDITLGSTLKVLRDFVGILPDVLPTPKEKIVLSSTTLTLFTTI
jgi:hypothetical protein